MDTANVPKLTITQLNAINEAVTAHRPASLIESRASDSKVCLTAISRRGDTLGSWDLELRDSDMLLRVIISETLYTEILPEYLSYRFDRALIGLEQWVKAMNAEELNLVLQGTPSLGHLMPEHLMNPSDYAPIGGVTAW